MTIPEQKTQMSFARLLTPKNLGKFPIFCRHFHDILPDIFTGYFCREILVKPKSAWCIILIMLCISIISYGECSTQK